MDLRELEREIHKLHSSLCLRATLEKAAALGNLLLAARRQLPHGQFTSWVRRVGVGHRAAQLYMQVSRHPASDGNVSLSEFLRQIRSAKAATKREEREAIREQTLRRAVPHEQYKVVNIVMYKRRRHGPIDGWLSKATARKSSNYWVPQRRKVSEWC